MDKEEYKIKFEESKNQVAQQMGYKDWETCINDQPNHMVEQLMDKVIELHHKHKMQEVIKDLKPFLENIEFYESIQFETGFSDLELSLPEDVVEKILTHLKNKI
jgi:hypothetical protein